MTNIKVLGLTTSSEFYIGSNEKNFRINEYLIVEDKKQGDLVFEVVEANTYNRYIPLNIGGDFVDSSVIEALQSIGYIVDDETIYIAKCRLMNEAQYPIETGSEVREPSFEEIKRYLINANRESGLLIGAIKNTDKLHDGMDIELKNLYHMQNDILEEQRDVPFLFNLYEMNQYPHIGVFGGSGSGKSYGLRVILEELMKRKIPTIIFDPHYEMDFQSNSDNPSASIEYTERYSAYTVGRDVGINFKELNSAELKKLLDAAGGMTDAMNATVDLLYRQYDNGKKGVDIYSFETKINDLLEMLSKGSREKIELMLTDGGPEQQQKAMRLLELYDDYNNKINEATLRGIAWRLWRNINDGVFAKDSTPVIDTLKLGHTAIIQGSSRILEVYCSYIGSKLYSMRRKYKDGGTEYFPPFVLVTDEAHNFSPKGYDKAPKAVIKEIAQEGRKYGVFLILATQRPTLLDETITAQLNSKFIFRTVRSTDIQTIREETDITSEESKRLPYLRTGDLFASVASIGRTISARVRAAETLKPNVENPFDELRNKTEEDDTKLLNFLEPYYPITENDALKIVADLEKNNIKMTVDSFLKKLNSLENKGYLKKEEEIFGNKFVKGE